MNEELKPCPFCGGKAQTQNENNYKVWYVICIRCESCTKFHSSEEKAINTWNTRAETSIPVSASTNSGIMATPKPCHEMNTTYGCHCNGINHVFINDKCMCGKYTYKSGTAS
jgi:Lar family restriction alleviation protein